MSKLSERMFPIQSERGAKPHPFQVPWSVAELAYSTYASRYGSQQTLERLSQRGGFSPGEMDEYCPDWRERTDENTTLRTLVGELSRTAERIKVKLEDALPYIGNPANPSHIPRAAINEAIDQLTAALAKADKIGGAND